MMRIMGSSKLCRGVLAAMVLCAASCSAYPQQQQQHDSAVTETAEEILPQKPMTLKNGYHPGLFPFNKGEPFVMDPNLGAIGFNTKPPPQQRQQQDDAQTSSDDFYDYDTRLEEVPYDYKGDPIDRKDVLEPKLPRPNDIKPAGQKNKLQQQQQQQPDIYQFLNLPVKYSSSDYKFPLMSSSYANTKVQGSGPSSLLSNHKMPATDQPPAVPSSAVPSTVSWYNPVRTTTTAFKPMPTTTTTPATTSTTTAAATTTTATTPRPTTTTTTVVPPSQQEYEDDYYDYFHSQDPVPETHVPSSTSTTTTTTTTTRRPPPSVITPEPVTTTTTASTTTPKLTSTTTTTIAAPAQSAATDKSQYHNTDNDYYSPPAAAATATTTTTTARPEIDSKPDGTSFADYDTIKSPPAKEHYPQKYGQNFKPLPAAGAGDGYPFDDKTYPLITNGKVPMTFTAHVSSGISLNQKEHPSDRMPPTAVVSEPVYSSKPQQQQQKQQQQQQHHHQQHHQQQQSEVRDTIIRPVQEHTMYDDNSRLPAKPVQHEPPMTYDDNPRLPSNLKPKPPKPTGTDQFETVYYKVRPDGYPQQMPNAANRPVQSRPYQPEPPATKPSQADLVRKPAAATELQAPPPNVRPQLLPPPYPAVQSEVYTKNKPQYVPPQSQPDTSRFKPPKHVINHFIKTLPTDDNKSYALQTSFSIGMDGERTADPRPAQGIGQVLMVEDGGPSETVVDQTASPIVKPKLTTSVPLVPPPRPVQKPSPPYPRPQWENVPKQPQYYSPPPKRDNQPPPPPPPQPQRTNLPNILPQFRPNAKVDTPPPMAPPPPQSHSATIERVQMPTDHLRPPPLPKPQFLKLDRNDDNADDEILDIPEKETRILQRTGPQPAKVTTLQMIQHGAPAKTRDDNHENPVHVVYAANSSPRPVDKLSDDSVILDVKDRSDVPILKTKTVNNNKPVKTDFPYQIVKPDENQTGPSSLEYQAYSPTRVDTVRPNHDQELVPNLQDYVPVTTRDSTSHNGAAAMSQKTIAATLKTSEDNHKSSADEGHKPQLHNFQIPFQPSLKLPENSNGWSVVRKTQTDNASDRIDETGGGDVTASTEKFDPDNFKPQLVGGFLPISSPLEDDKDKKTVEQSERAK